MFVSLSDLAQVLHGHLPLVLAVSGGLFVLMLLSRVRIIGTVISLVLMGGLLVAVANLVQQRAQIDPALDPIAKFLGRDQQIAGKEMRVKMSPDGHFWVHARIGGVERRMLVDSGATVTAISTQTAAEAGVPESTSPFPMMIRTANGTVTARSSEVGTLRIGNIVARDVGVVVSPAFGDMDVIGMNVLSRLKSWRVEGDTLILVPHHPQGVPGAGPAHPATT